MKQSHTLGNLSLIGLTLLSLAFVRGATTPPQNAPLPLPDVTFYGTTTVGGEIITSGTVKAILPRGGPISVPIAPIQGTDYTYALAVPLNVFDDLATAQLPADAVVFNDAIRFTINDQNAQYNDANGMTVEAFTIPQDAMGGTYILDLMIARSEDYILGDVNVNGQRDSADALLVLRYDVGLISGDMNFPPTPGKIYLPLCDIVADGRCNASDALRILQCDVGLPGVNCPPSASQQMTALADAPSPAPGTPLAFRLEVEGSQGQALNVRVIADDAERRLGAVSLELDYDAAQLTPEGCAQDPQAVLDAATCYADSTAGSVRMNAAAVAGAGPGAILAQVTFASAAGAPADGFTLKVKGVFDLEGQALVWTSDPAQTSGPAQRIFLPVVIRQIP